MNQSEEPSRINVPVKMSDGSSSLEELPLQLPHHILEYLFNTCKLEIEKQSVLDYWNHLDSVGHSFAKSSKEFREARGSGQVVPIGLYGDSACLGLVNQPMAKVLGLFLNIVLFRPTSTRMSRYMLWSIYEDKIVSMEHTVYPVLEEIVESCHKAAAQGVNGMYFLTSEIRGDQMFFSDIFRYKSRWTSNDVCYRCKASSKNPELIYTHYPGASDDQSGWAGTLRSTEEFILEELTSPLSFSECGQTGFSFKRCCSCRFKGLALGVEMLT